MSTDTKTLVGFVNAAYVNRHTANAKYPDADLSGKYTVIAPVGQVNPATGYETVSGIHLPNEFQIQDYVKVNGVPTVPQNPPPTTVPYSMMIYYGTPEYVGSVRTGASKTPGDTADKTFSFYEILSPDGTSTTWKKTSTSEVQVIPDPF